MKMKQKKTVPSLGKTFTVKNQNVNNYASKKRKRNEC